MYKILRDVMLMQGILGIYHARTDSRFCYVGPWGGVANADGGFFPISRWADRCHNQGR